MRTIRRDGFEVSAPASKIAAMTAAYEQLAAGFATEAERRAEAEREAEARIVRWRWA